MAAGDDVERPAFLAWADPGLPGPLPEAAERGHAEDGLRSLLRPQ